MSYVERDSRGRHRDSSRERFCGYRRSRSPSRRSDSNRCYLCGRSGHYKKVCPEIECHNCYSEEHISKDFQSGRGVKVPHILANVDRVVLTEVVEVLITGKEVLVTGNVVLTTGETVSKW